MTTLTLLARAYGVSQLNLMGDALKLSLEDLDIETKILGTAAGKSVQIAIAGEDEGIATNYIAKEIGFCPVNFEGVEKNSLLKGYVTDFGKSREELVVDVGVFQPKTVHATVSLDHLQAQLVDGREVALEKIGELFGFCRDLPLSIKVVRVNEELSLIEAELSAWQVEKYGVWQRALLDKLIIVGSTLQEAKDALEYANLSRDVISVESLGMFEHVLTCKLGTDAAGLIPKIGRILKNARFAVFNPKKLKKFLET